MFVVIVSLQGEQELALAQLPGEEASQAFISVVGFL